MHLRRALLLFAIVLGLAAVAASLSRPREETGRSDAAPGLPATSTEREQPTAAPGTAQAAPVELTFGALAGDTRRLRVGQAATLLVEVDEPGQVEIPALGMSAAAEPLTPARFEVLPSRSGRYPISFHPAAGDGERRAGTLVVAAARQ